MPVVRGGRDGEGTRPVWVRGLPIGGGPVVVCWHKRIWYFAQVLCANQSWTETRPEIAGRAVLTERARVWAFDQVGHHDAAVSAVAATLGVSWATIMRIVTTLGMPVIAATDRLGGVSAVGR